MKSPDILKALEPLIKAFDELGILYYISGSVASSAYGAGRSTLDIDMVSNMNAEKAKMLVHKLSDQFYIDEQMILYAINTRSSFNLLHLETMMKIDVFILKDDPFSKTAFKRKRQDNLTEEGKTLQIYLSSPEDIILNKLKWFEMGGGTSERQWNDILGVMKIQKDNLDYEYLEKWAKELNILELLKKAEKEIE